MNASHAITTQASSQQRTRLGKSAVRRKVCGTLGALGTSMGLALAALPASATLANAGFETPTIISYGTLLTSPINTVTGVWGQENSAIVGTGPFLPSELSHMLQMSDDGGGTTQAGQFFAVTPTTPTITFGALFNADLPAAKANVSLTFFSGNTYNTLSAVHLGAGLNLDPNPGTWEPMSVTATAPGGTQYALAQVWYSNVSLIDHNGALGMGYVDETFTAAVPEPETYGLMALGLAVLGFKLRRRSEVVGS